MQVIMWSLLAYGGGGGIGLHLEWGVFIFGDQQRTNTCKTNEKRLFGYFKILLR